VVDDTRGQAGHSTPEDHSHDIYTLANIITVMRLMMVPFAFDVLISNRSDVLAFALFALAASTDWLDGQIARRTGTVTELGKAFDPVVDRLLIAAGVLGLYLVDRLPLWLVVLLLVRDAYLLAGAALLAQQRRKRIPVIYVGKATTMLLLAGFSGLILGWPEVPGLGWFGTAQVLPGFGQEPVILWIWLVYAGTVLSMITAALYTVTAVRSLRGEGAA